MDTAIYKPRNEGIEIRLRRYRDALALSGGMVIALSVWDIIKLYSPRCVEKLPAT